MFVRTGTLSFPSFRNDGPQLAEQAVSFPGPVEQTAALLAGFDVQFVDADHHLHQLEVDVTARSLSRQAVEVSGELGLRDRSGQWDDRYAGTIRYVVVGARAPEQLVGGTLSIPSREGTGPRSVSENVQFARAMDHSAVGITGLMARFSGADHELLHLEAALEAQRPAPDLLQVTGTYGLRDSSGNWDDEYDGLLRYAGLGSAPLERRASPILTGRLDFPPLAGEGPRRLSTRLTFGDDVGDCAAVLTGLLLAYDRNDHEVHRIMVDVEARKLGGREVEVVAQLGLRDDSGFWDDAYRGTLRFAVIGE